MLLYKQKKLFDATSIRGPTDCCNNRINSLSLYLTELPKRKSVVALVPCPQVLGVESIVFLFVANRVFAWLLYLCVGDRVNVVTSY